MVTTQTQHTPGPWAVTRNERERTVQIDTANGRGTVVQPGAISWLPDAPVIAAAPELLALVVKVVEIADGRALHRGLEDEARALLARLEGR